MKRKYTRRSRSQWAELVARQQSGGQHINAFCEAEGLTPSTFHYWQKKLKADRKPGRPKGFVEVVARPVRPVSGSILLRGRGGVEAEVPCGVPADVIRQVVDALSC